MFSTIHFRFFNRNTHGHLVGSALIEDLALGLKRWS
jgi:hypothetical protein